MAAGSEVDQDGEALALVERIGVHIRQGYLAEEGAIEVRLRITTTKATLTVKAGTGMSRTEVEVAISVDEADALWPHTVGRRIDKTRHRVLLDGAHGLVLIQLIEALA